MKIRHKQSGVELEGVRDSGPDFVEGASVFRPSSIYSKEHWEAVPEWVNVTGECGVKNDNPCMVLTPVGVQVNVNDGYRLRKVQVKIDGFPKWAFIVERKA